MGGPGEQELSVAPTDSLADLVRADPPREPEDVVIQGLALFARLGSVDFWLHSRDHLDPRGTGSNHGNIFTFPTVRGILGELDLRLGWKALITHPISLVHKSASKAM